MPGSEDSEDERRRGERIPINHEFAGLDPQGSPPERSSTWVSDLSHGGVFVHTEDVLPVGTMIELRFTILVDDPVVLEVFAKIVRHSHKPRGMGVAFTSMTPDMSQRIELILARQRPLDSGAPLRLPEPRRPPPQGRAFAQPAPVGRLQLKRVSKQELEDADTTEFPRAGASATPSDGEATMIFRPPPAPKGTVAQTLEDDLTRRFESDRRRGE